MIRAMVVARFCRRIGALLLWWTLCAQGEEFRAAWVASVYNLNFPSRAGLPAEVQEEQIRTLVQGARRAGLNALMLQVRPEGDALYESRLEPWSRYLTGTQGLNPGYDPLEAFIQEGRKHGIAIHAWINPYRAAANAGAPRSATHETTSLRASVRQIGNTLWLDPGAPEVRQHLFDVVRDLVRRYDIAGVVLDDYFYPYPGKGYARGTFPDRPSYTRYLSGGGSLDQESWRRQNVDTLIEGLHAVVKSTKPQARFGVSPFGIYMPGQPAGVTADLNQYRDLYADPVKWLRNGWVDYLSPQLYWRDGGPQSYSSLLRWWRSAKVNPRGIPVFPSIALERLGSGFGWPAGEIGRQLYLERVIQPRGPGGFILWNVGPLLQNQKGVAGLVAGT
ncbi:MAG: family 10 glycosylhydrolase [Verrucomicrobia bacterium]|nr:family 10 glycosylhydrolase [Verrucomicrobiota bacterium]